MVHLLPLAGLAIGGRGPPSSVVAVTAARRGARVTALELTPELLEVARQNAPLAGVEVDFHEGDVEALPFDAGAFDVVLSQLGHMFAPRPEVAIAEMLRVLKPGGTVAFSTWHPELFTGRMFTLTAKCAAPPPPGIPPPTLWGEPGVIRERMGKGVRDLSFATVPATGMVWSNQADRRVAIIPCTQSPTDPTATVRFQNRPPEPSVTDKRLLIINADDLGYDPEVTRGILESMREGVVSSATLMVNTPHSEDAARAGVGLALGLHLNLGRHAPVSPHFPRSLLENGELVESRAGELSAEMVEDEVRAQLERLRQLVGAPATHVDVHKHLHRQPSVLEGLARAARALQLPVRALDEPMRRRLELWGVLATDHFIGDAGVEPYWTEQRFVDAVSLLKPGVTELMCHPGYRPVTLKSGYAEQREVELKTFTAPGARAALERAGVELGSFKNLPT